MTETACGAALGPPAWSAERWRGLLAIAKRRRRAWVESPQRQREYAALAARRVTLNAAAAISTLVSSSQCGATHPRKFMSKSRSDHRLDRAVVVVTIIAGAIGCALWDVHEVSRAIATGKLVPAAAASTPSAPAPSPMAAASAAAAVPDAVLLAGLAR